jgi:DNA-binding MarR family transcriptional regulator
LSKLTTSIDFGILLGLAYQTFVDELRAHLDTLGFDDMGKSYGYVFRALNEEALHLRQLAERLGMSDQGASKIVNEMEARGYLERYPDAIDGRIKKLKLSRRGLAALSAARQFHQTYEENLVASLTTKQQLATTRRVLEAMVATTGGDAEHARLRAM